MEKKFRITVDGRSYIVTVEDLSEGGSLILPEPGSMHVPAPPAPPREAPAAGAVEPGDEVSPLAGVIHSLDVTVGQSVQEGDKIASLEAMKMVTQVFARRAGKVTRILVKPGDAVAAGQVLLTIA